MQSMIYARVDVDLRDHERAHRAGEAMSTWLWGLLYSRAQETDGRIPSVALRGAWVGEAKALEHARALVDAGLWTVITNGWEIVGYAIKNETKAAIAERRLAEREKKAKYRQKHASTRDRAVDSEANAAPLPAPSPREEDHSQSQSQSQGHPVDSTGASPVDAGALARPDWFDNAVSVVEEGTGEVLDRPAAWIRYRGARKSGSRGKAMSFEDAQAWLVSVDVKEARERRAKGIGKVIKQAGVVDAPWRRAGA